MVFRDVRKAMVFGLAGLAGALLGELVSEPVRDSGAQSLTGLMVSAGTWTALMTLGAGLALIVAQNRYLHRPFMSLSQGAVAIPGTLAAGAVAGAIAQWLYASILFAVRERGTYGPILAMAIRILAWALAGGLLAGGLSFFVPNLKGLRALLGGGIGGAAGAIAFLSVADGLGYGALVARIVGAALLGFFIGLMVALVEAVFREVWLEIHYGPKEVRIVSLGHERVSLGGDQNACTVYAANVAPVAYRYWVKDNAIFCEDVLAQSTANIAVGDRKQIGNLVATVCGVVKAIQPVAQKGKPGVSTLRLSNGRSLQLSNGALFKESDLPGLRSRPPGGPVAQVSSHPADPSIFGLQNLSHLPWRAYLISGDSIEVKPGKNVRIAPGTRVNFGSIEGKIES